jgi:hypothetical protein
MMVFIMPCAGTGDLCSIVRTREICRICVCAIEQTWRDRGIKLPGIARWETGHEQARQ